MRKSALSSKIAKREEAAAMQKEPEAPRTAAHSRMYAPIKVGK